MLKKVIFFHRKVAKDGEKNRKRLNKQIALIPFNHKLPGQ